MLHAVSILNSRKWTHPMPLPQPAAPGFFEAEYNNRALVPESGELIAAWADKAAGYRADRPDALLNQSYGHMPRQVFDLFPRQMGTAERPYHALYIHGGYWQALSKDSSSHMAKGLNAHGFDVTIANYTLCPDVSVADITEEMRLLAAELYKRSGKKLLVTGHSAGGHLTAELMATDWTALGLPEDLCARGMPISGLFDLEPLVQTSVNTALKLSEDSAKAASPLHARPADFSRVVAVVGGAESSEYIRQSRSLCETWGAHGVETHLDIVPDANHFTVIDPLADPASFLTAHLLALAETV